MVGGLEVTRTGGKKRDGHIEICLIHIFFQKKISCAECDKIISFDYEDVSSPNLVMLVPRLCHDLEMWEAFFQCDVPVQLPLRHV